MPNWKEGIDWATDPTGATAKANHYFVAPWGDDGTGTGTAANPWQTIATAIASTSSTATIVIYTGVYQETGLSAGTRNIIGDGSVMLLGAGSGIGLTIGGSNNYVKNIIFKNYDTGLRITNSANSTYAEDCVFVNAGLLNQYTFTGGAFGYIRGCILINSVYTAGQATARRDTTFDSIIINSPISGNGTHRGCYIDENSHLTMTVAGDPATNSNIRGSITIDGTSYTDLAAANAANPTYFSGCVDLDPKFNNAEGGDFSLAADSPHIGAGNAGNNIGGTTFGQSYFYGSEWLDAIIDSDANLTYNVSTGEIEVAADTVVETGEFQESNLRYLPRLDLCGFPSLDNDAIIALAGQDRLIYECAWSGLDGIYGPWKRFRFGEIPSVDTLGNYNGEEDYRWGETEKIIMYKRKYRFTFRANGL
ncbi:hypothetical protein [Marinoscillum furvescens]|uniref:DUF1565 domain-containing protein n=1 Tax=Marinoscillum furvescens DSM 4134 TaxID=1122208 RepID=A0A3D9L7K7_MARFU|nr:hypothetical protein [Marinoscillum furvescens]REE01101.1 hypothetical protein C7460_104121 [Marinoscillum furvescens DSM 4134]